MRIKTWAKIVQLEKGIVLFTIRRDPNNPTKAQLCVEADIGAFVPDADFGIARTVLADLNYESVNESFLHTFADAQRAKDVVKMLILSWHRVQSERPTTH